MKSVFAESIIDIPKKGRIVLKPILIALVGPTGSGKTKTAIQIGRKIGGEIVSMDSMQIYRGMDIGTAKPTIQEREAIAHHMIDIADPKEIFTVSAYREMAMKTIDGILERGHVPLLVGGTGLYLQALSYDLTLGDQGANSEIRDRLRKIAEETDGPQRLHDRLSVVDPESAKKLHPNDIRRVIRALEIYETSGKAKSEQADTARTEGPYHILVYGLSYPREQMYARINARVDEMMDDGLVDEVKRLLEQGVEPNREGGAMQAIGYKEIVSALRGEYSIARAVDLIKQGSRRYAKRQWTWFRHDERVKWFDFSEYADQDSLWKALLLQIEQDTAAYRGRSE